MAIKIICDICNKEETSEKEFIVPMITEYNAIGKNNEILLKTTTIKPQTINICEKCQAQIAAFLQQLGTHNF